jgi:hypothetical protein
MAKATMVPGFTRAALAAAALLFGACGGGAQQLPDDKPLIAGSGGEDPLPVGEKPADAQATPPKPKGAVTPAKVARPGLLGEMCLDRGAGRPALALLMTRQVGWSVDARELEHLGQHQAQRPFVVLSGRGARAGIFEAIGPVDLGTAAPALTGGYAGKPPCEDKEASWSTACTEAQGKCGLAVASLAVDGDSEPPPLHTGTACVEGGKLLLVDLDGDGVNEAFPVSGFLDELRAPAAEVGAEVPARATCTPAFSLPGLVRGKDAKAFRALDLLGVVDLDDDGRVEVVMQYRYASVRTWGVYSADPTLGKLTLVAEVEPWAAD